MAVTVVNNPGVQPLSSAPVICAILAGGPFDNVDAYVQGGNWSDGQIKFQLIATVGALPAVVAEAPYQGPGPSRLDWQWLNGADGAAHHGGTVYTLTVVATQTKFATSNRGPAMSTATNPTPVDVTIAGVNNGDVAADNHTSGSVALPGDGSEVQVTTALGFINEADVSARMLNMPAIHFRLFANCGAGSVEVLVQEQVSNDLGNPLSGIMLGVQLPVATQYRLTAAKVVADGVLGPNVLASLATLAEGAGGGGGGPVVLTGNALGTSNANRVETFNIEGGNADVAAATFNALNPTGGLFYVGFAGLTANRVVNLPASEIGSRITVKDEDGSLAAFNETLTPSDGSLIDGAVTLVMTAVAPGPFGSVTLERVAGPNWAVV